MSLNPADRALSDDDLRALFGGDIRLHEQVAYYLDENMMADVLISALRAAGILVTTVDERGLAGHPSDFVVLADARRLGCVFVTLDRGYELLHERLVALEAAHAGIFLFDGEISMGNIEDILIRLADKSLDYPFGWARQLVKNG